MGYCSFLGHWIKVHSIADNILGQGATRLSILHGSTPKIKRQLTDTKYN